MASEDYQIINYLMRMMAPLRREFDQSLDVQRFLHDLDYAQHVLKNALVSQDMRLREHAEYVKKLRLGPRLGVPDDTPPTPKTISQPPASTVSKPAASAPDVQKPTLELIEEDLQTRIMKKYTSGLR